MKPISFTQLFDEAGKRLQEEQERLARMTPEQRFEYAKAQARKEREVEDLLKKLGGGRS